VGQPLVSALADIVYDPFVEQEKAESGYLLVHYSGHLFVLGNPFRPFPLPPGGMKTPRTVGPR